MKVLFLTKYTALGASSRMRTYQYMASYRAAGIECVVKPFFNDAYLRRFYNGKRGGFFVFYFYIRRLIVLLSVFKYDKVYIEKEIFPYLPSFAEYLLHLFNKEYIVDYDDAIFHNYDRNPKFLLRKLLKNKIDSVMKYATVVIAGNHYLAKRAVAAKARKIVIIPTVVDLARYKIAPSKNQGRIVLGWIGTKSTFEKHLLFAKDWLIKAQELFDIELHIIGITENEMFLGNKVRYLAWTQESEVADLAKIDIGIMPLRNSPWEEGKCAYKIIQYLASGKPVIASNVGMNSDLCIEGETGFLADTAEEFLNAVETLIKEEQLRYKMGRKGRDLIENKFNTDVTSEKLIKIILE